MFFDKLVGQRVRARRVALGLTQSEPGKAAGITFQQIQKYEKGVNCIGASRLITIAAMLDVPVQYFFDASDRRTSRGVRLRIRALLICYALSIKFPIPQCTTNWWNLSVRLQPRCPGSIAKRYGFGRG